MFRHQHHRDCHHHLIRNRIEERAKAGTLVPATRQITIKPVRNGSDQENQRTGKRRPDDRQVKCQDEERNEHNAKKSEQRRDIKSHDDGNCLLSVKFSSMLLQSPQCFNE
ncbi:Uncharacterised protein [Enterobacter cloacae]|nr:Uncharacterised protein [Enterobacter cloacae]